MSLTRDTRRCALQALFQFDARGIEDLDQIGQSLAGSPGDARTHARGLEVAQAAWDVREQADAAVADISANWPTHRQPIIDRSLLRLCYYEMTSGVTAPKIAINEAIELAREYSTDKSPMFINGIMDKIYKAMLVPNDDTTDSPDAREAKEQL